MQTIDTMRGTALPPDRPGDAIDAEDQLIVDMDGFEGPLDLLLALARTRKLDLTHLSMLELAKQYLVFIEEAGQLRLEIAADYLVMAAWLAYLKSRLLLPKAERPADEPDGSDMALALAFRLRRLEAMRQAGQTLLRLPQLGQDVFARGLPEQPDIVVETCWTADLHDLVTAYIARQRKQAPAAALKLPQRQVWSIKDARERLARWLGPDMASDWISLDLHLQKWLGTGKLGTGNMHRTARASSLGAILEMAREGALDIRQSEAFGPILVRRLSPEEISG